MSKNSSSEAQIPTSDCNAQTDGASKMTSSAYKSIAVQIARILHPTLALLTYLTKSSMNMLNKYGGL